MNGEFALIDQLGRHLASAGGSVRVGPGDDAAVIDMTGGQAVLAVDALVEGRHWLPELSSLGDVGWKAIAVNVSDLAAMGADPVAAIVALHRPAEVSVADVQELYAGMAEAATRYGVALVGGDTVSSSVLAVSVTVLGRCEAGRAVTRDGAEPGHVLVCVGTLGAASAALASASQGDGVDARRARPDGLAAHRRPRALLGAGKVLAAAGARAMIDVSDGLGADLAHICRASGVRAQIRYAALPVAEGVDQAARHLGVNPLTFVSGGEDYALLAALPADRAAAAIAEAAQADGVPAAIIGTVASAGDPGVPLVTLETDGGDVDLSGWGYDHYERA